jgi:RNA-directed DNA polymerase
VEKKMTEAPEPKDKLDAATTVVVSGPEDDVLRWRQIDWRRAEADVRRLRQRIFTASKAGDLARVRRLQKLMLRSRANTLISVRRVTERNAGRLTAGLDGEVVLTPEAKMQLVDRVQHNAEPFKAMPVRRVYIPKPGGKRRPLGIPVILDRVHQARVVNALEPEWEARFEPRSYGFRPGRGCQDAIQAVHETAKGKSAKRLWALDADLASAFDLIAHDHIQSMIGTFPARGMIRAWLKAGVVEQGRLHRTEDGVPQGGVVSPLLLNVALHGMEQAAGVRYYQTGNSAGKAMRGSPVLIRYADDFVALCHTRQEALEVKARLATWLAPRGLAFNEDKTRVVTLAEGFDFLGFNVRRYYGKLLIKPSKAAIRRIRERLRTELRSLRGFNAGAVVRKLNPIIRGWANYYRTHVAAEIFDKLDQHLWRLAYKWARFSHANKSASWVIARYFGKFNKARQDRWVFGDRHSGAYLHKFSWTSIVRHQTVWQRASPDDLELADYWARRRSRSVLPITKTDLWLFKAQDGCCPICKTPLFADQPQTPSDWATWLTATRKATMIVKPMTDTPDEADHRLIHARCGNRSGTALLPAYQPTGLA